jgi:hypothetical protein
MLDKAEKFLIEKMGDRHPEIPRSKLLQYAVNYNLEKETEKFNSEDYENEEQRATAMFPGMPENELKTISILMYKHRSTDHGEDHEKRIKELEEEIKEDSELLEMSIQRWWNN